MLIYKYFNYFSSLVSKGKCFSYSSTILTRECSTKTATFVEATEREVVVGDKKYINREVDDETLKNLQHVSRMPEKYRNRMLHILKPDPDEVNPDYYKSLFQRPAFKKMLFAWYGNKSGIDPGILWPSAEELKDIVEFENENEVSLQKMWEKLEQDKETERKEVKEKEDLIATRMAKMPQFIEDYRKKLKKTEDQEKSLKAKKQVLDDEARDYFGYKIDANDPRFEQLKLAKEEEEKKLLKKNKKEEKIARALKYQSPK